MPKTTSVDLSAPAKQSNIGKVPISEEITNYLTEEVRASGEKDATKVRDIVAKKVVALKGLIETANKNWTRYLKAREVYEEWHLRNGANSICDSGIKDELEKSCAQAKTSFKAIFGKIFTKAEKFESMCTQLDRDFSEELFTQKFSNVRTVKLLERKKVYVERFMDNMKRDIALLQDSASRPNKSLFNGFCQKIISGARTKPSVATGAAGRVIKGAGKKALQSAERAGLWEIVVSAGKKLFKWGIKVAPKVIK